MGISTLIKTLTASNSAALAFVDGASDVVLDDTYDEYMFVCTNLNPATDSVEFQFQVNATDDAGGGYDTSLITSTMFRTQHNPSNDATSLGYIASGDLEQSASYQQLFQTLGNLAAESASGILHLFNPASTTYVKHFLSRFTGLAADPQQYEFFVAGYINDTTAIDEINFQMSSGNFDGVIQLYGIA